MNFKFKKIHFWMAEAARLLLAYPAAPQRLEKNKISACFKIRVLQTHSDRGGQGDMRELIKARELLYSLVPKTNVCTTPNCLESPYMNEKCKYHAVYTTKHG